MKRLRSVPVVVALILIGVLVGCSEDAMKPDRAEPTPDRTTMAGLVTVYEQALAEGDMEKYAACLDPEYRFWIEWPCEVPPELPDFLDRATDLATTGNMLTHEWVDSIYVSLDVDSGYVQKAGGVLPDTFTYYQAPFGVSILVVEMPDGDDPVWERVVAEYRVDGPADVCIRRDSADPNLWTIWKIEDRTGEKSKDSAEEQVTWAYLKLLYL